MSVAFGIDSVIEFAAALVVLQSFRAERAGRMGLVQKVVRNDLRGWPTRRPRLDG